MIPWKLIHLQFCPLLYFGNFYFLFDFNVHKNDGYSMCGLAFFELRDKNSENFLKKLKLGENN